VEKLHTGDHGPISSCADKEEEEEGRGRGREREEGGGEEIVAKT
jgi:hypothetical protein